MTSSPLVHFGIFYLTLNSDVNMKTKKPNQSQTMLPAVKSINKVAQGSVQKSFAKCCPPLVIDQSYHGNNNQALYRSSYLIYLQASSCDSVCCTSRWWTAVMTEVQVYFWLLQPVVFGFFFVLFFRTAFAKPIRLAQKKKVKNGLKSLILISDVALFPKVDILFLIIQPIFLSII